ETPTMSQNPINEELLLERSFVNFEIYLPKWNCHYISEILNYKEKIPMRFQHFRSSTEDDPSKVNKFIFTFAVKVVVIQEEIQGSLFCNGLIS
ncbi:10549_t:CDS:2, partial [Dentiscutata erythropus]